MLSKKNNRGFVLIASYMVITVLMILAIAFITKSVIESNLARRKQYFIQALYLAEAGIDYGLVQLREGILAGSNTDSLAGIGTYSCNWTSVIITSTGNGEGVSRSVEVALRSFASLDGVNSAIETEGNLEISGNVEINGDVRDLVAAVIDIQAAAGDAAILVNDTTGFIVNDQLLIDEGSGGEELVKISSINELNSSITLENELSFSHSTGASVRKTLVFESIFGVSKAAMKEIAQESFPQTYYETPFSNHTATEITWIDASGSESQITQNDWSGDGIFIVEGDLKITGGTFSGIIWVIGTLIISGNPVINGAIFAESGFTVDTEITGTAEINYSSEGIGNGFSYLTSLPIAIESWREL